MKIVLRHSHLGWKGRGTAKTERTLDVLRPFPSLVWVACLDQFVLRQQSLWMDLVARDGV
jgi:hypothetical protein